MREDIMLYSYTLIEARTLKEEAALLQKRLLEVQVSLAYMH
jgi:hypothetical protein